jgi:hypothetical protein
MSLTRRRPRYLTTRPSRRTQLLVAAAILAGVVSILLPGPDVSYITVGPDHHVAVYTSSWLDHLAMVLQIASLGCILAALISHGDTVSTIEDTTVQERRDGVRTHP